MALVKCPECGRENVSDTAEVCPNCGFNIKLYYGPYLLGKLTNRCPAVGVSPQPVGN